MELHTPLFILSTFPWAKQRQAKTGLNYQIGQRRPLCCAAASDTVQNKVGSNEKDSAAHRRRKPGRLQYWAKENSRQISDVKKGDPLIGTVREVGPAQSAWVDVNLATSGGRAVHARLRLQTKKNGKVKTDLTTGAVIPVHVRRVMPDSGRLEVGLGIEPPRNPLLVDEKNSRPLESLQQGEQLNGTIMAVGSYGAVVDVGVHRKGRNNRIVKFPGLLPHRHFPPRWATTADSVKRADVERVLAIGDAVTVWVRLVYPLSPFLLLDGNPVDMDGVKTEQLEKQRNRRKFKRKKRTSTVSIGDQRRGFVREVASFGLFVDLGLQRDVLLHYSAMGEEFAKTWKYELIPGTPLDVEVIKVEDNNVAVRLLSVPLPELEKAQETAASPSARPEDVKYVSQLLKKERAAGNRTGALLGSDPSTSSGRDPSTDSEQQREIETDDQHDDDDDDGDDDSGNNDDDDIEEFSDDYFEDKYGF